MCVLIAIYIDEFSIWGEFIGRRHGDMLTPYRSWFSLLSYRVFRISVGSVEPLVVLSFNNMLLILVSLVRTPWCILLAPEEPIRGSHGHTSGMLVCWLYGLGSCLFYWVRDRWHRIPWKMVSITECVLVLSSKSPIWLRVWCCFLIYLPVCCNTLPV